MRETIGPLLLAFLVVTVLVVSELQALAARRTKIISERIVRFGLRKRLIGISNNS